jgi:hypothetical protein
MDWRKSSYSGANGGNCVETASNGGVIRVRDTTDSDVGPVLCITVGAWQTFLRTLR